MQKEIVVGRGDTFARDGGVGLGNLISPEQVSQGQQIPAGKADNLVSRLIPKVLQCLI